MTSLTRAYQAELKKTRTAVADHVARQFKALPNYYDDQVDPFLERVLPVVEAGQSRAVALTSAYLSAKLGIAPVGLQLDKLTGGAVRGGINLADVYSRPFVTVRAAIMTIGIEAAINKGLARLKSTADMDVAMSARDATVAFGQENGSRVIGWVRVADPDCCDFCQMIDGARTGPTEPQPLHNNCGCTADPIEADSSSAGDLSNTLAPGDVIHDVAIEMHGELGPVITYKDDNFTSVHDLPDAYKQEVTG